MKYNFDKIVNRYNTDCIKYDFKEENNKSDDVLPLWIADMDFLGEKKVVDAINKASKNGIFGYTGAKDDYYKCLQKWYTNNFGFEFDKSEVVLVPGVVFALGIAIHAYTDKGDAVIINEPVYHPFKNIINKNERKVVNSNLELINGHYEMNFDDIEAKIRDNKVKLYVLCSPHNPCGRVWKKNELERIIKICEKYNVIIFSDEIHSDFAYYNNHYNLFTVNDKASDIALVATAPSKTFNIAGLQVSHIFFKNKKLEEKYKSVLDSLGGCEPNMLGLVASKACYEYGEDWLKNVKEYLKSNLDYVRSEVSKIDGIDLIEPEGTYLLWLDLRGLNKTNLYEWVEKDCKIWINEGSMFGEAGDGFIRLNIATSRKNLEEAFKRIKANL